MRIGIYFTLAAMLGSVCLFADDDAERAKLIGSWQADGADLTWTISYTTTSVKVTENAGSNKVAEFACTVDSKPCDVKIAGKKASVSFWFNGPKLVELETRGNDTVERRFAAATAADAMDMEVVPMAGNAKHAKFLYKRALTVTASKAP